MLALLPLGQSAAAHGSWHLLVSGENVLPWLCNCIYNG